MLEEVGVVMDKSTWSFSGMLATQGISFWINILMLIIILFWVLSIIWVAKDIMARSNRLSLQVLSVFLVTFFSPIVGLPIYRVIRPIGFMRDRLPWREAAVMNLVVCYNCGTLNPKEHECCLACGEALKIKCKQCGKDYPHSYGYCHFCGAPNID
ncbi:hypothetical protein P148_SR1C00001G0094 [candidate division SR1 bacterium RAAC1_SR1_1]|nr:hypothetical protein P148_SR1C00001G0094 [candidate division SR1 bacterium RAAC1_SR1_1]